MRGRMLALLVAAEVVVGAMMAAVAWRMLGGVQQPARPTLTSQAGAVVAPGPGGAGRASKSPGPTAVGALAPKVPVAGRGGRAASLARLSTDPGFLGGRLQSLNRDQSAWAAAEWRIVDAVLTAARRYLNRVVVPSVERAEASRAP